MGWWDDLTQDNQTTIVVFGIIALTVVAIGLIVAVAEVLMKAGI